MSDHATDTITLMVTLDTSELCRAARLGGLPIALDEQLIDDPDLSNELVRFFAKRGLQMALQEHYARQYPQHYPEDVEDSFWGNDKPVSVSGDFIHQWRGIVTW